MPRSFVLFFLLVFLAGCAAQEPSTVDEPGTYAAWSADTEYVGIQVCADCHEQQYQSYSRSQMGRSFKLAEKALSDASWDVVRPIHSALDDLYYQPFADGEDLFVHEYRLAGADTVHSRIEQIDYIVGSGQHTNSHIYEENGFLYQIPVTWYAQDEKWDLAPKFQKVGNNYRFGRVITDECMACHNAQPTFVEGSENRFEMVPEGINCEKCHGPGSVHVEAMKAGKAVNTVSEIDYTIVNPGKLTPELELDVCKRCHMQGASVFADGQNPLDWRPGLPLSSHENVFWPRQPDSTTHFIMASHPDRLAMSSCFKESWNEERGFDPITCTTCHDPHSPIEETSGETYSATCQNCHTGTLALGASSLTCTEPDVVSGAIDTPCASCHLPLSGSTDIPHIQITDHYIRVPDKLQPEEVEDQERFIRLAAMIDTAPDAHNLADGFLTYFEQFTDRPGMLDSAEVYLRRVKSENTPSLTSSWIRLWHLQEDHTAIRRTVQSSPNKIEEDAWTYYRIGEAFEAINDFPSSIRWLRKAIELGPDHLRFRDKLGVSLTRAGQINEAISLYDRMLQDNALYENAWNNRGFARLMIEDLEGAESDFKAALALSPDMELAMANLASFYLNTNRNDEAIPLVRRLIKRYPQNAGYAQVWTMLTAVD